MKTQKKNGQGLYLQKKNNNRWKWMAGATATAAGVNASQAGTITINLVGNYISAIGGNHLNADLTGDGHSDLTISNAAAYHDLHYIGSTPFFRDFAGVKLNGVSARAYNFGDGGPEAVNLGSQFRSIRYTSPGGTHFGSTLMGSIPITFRDLRINNGALTNGSLEVTVSVFVPGGSAEVHLDSLTYNTRENVPDQGSSLTLLAMGASGVLALRRWRAAQRRA
jgi:hypothetical protein